MAIKVSPQTARGVLHLLKNSTPEAARHYNDVSREAIRPYTAQPLERYAYILDILCRHRDPAAFVASLERIAQSEDE